jgi:hypothetical protein
MPVTVAATDTPATRTAHCAHWLGICLTDNGDVCVGVALAAVSAHTEELPYKLMIHQLYN